jgi:hypothetical protein
MATTPQKPPAEQPRSAEEQQLIKDLEPDAPESRSQAIVADERQCRWPSHNPLRRRGGNSWASARSLRRSSGACSYASKPLA